jgi:hypothetical protein
MLHIELLKDIHTYDGFFELSRKLSLIEEKELFEFLFHAATNERGGNVNGTAGRLLIDLDPKASDTCDVLVHKIAKSKWDVSNKEIPFYLVTQFGKWNLAAEIKKVVNDNSYSDQERRLAEGVWYWASGPASKLSHDLHYFEWQEAIEGELPEA